MDALELSCDIIEYLNRRGSCISNLKLQKTLYYIQGYCLKNHHRPAFTNTILHWAYGPVVADVYYEYSVYGAEPIEPNGFRDTDKTLFDMVDHNMVHTIRQVIEACENYSASQLVEQTHQEDPWKQTERNQEIELEAINTYFIRNDPLKLCTRT